MRSLSRESTKKHKEKKTKKVRIDTEASTAEDVSTDEDEDNLVDLTGNSTAYTFLNCVQSNV